MKIQLAQSKLGHNRMKNGRDMMVFPLGLAAIVTYVKHHNPSADIEVVDGDFQSNLESKLDADIIGIQPNILNVDTDLMRKLHSRGQKIMIGGVHASQAASELIKHDFIDYVCNGDGEVPTLQLSKGISPELIDGLTTKKKQGRFQRIPLKTLPIIDRGLYDLNRYMSNSSLFFEKYAPDRPFRRIANVYTSKGCSWRAKTGGCYFCGRVYKELDIREPANVWAEIKSLQDKYKADFIWDVSDSFTSDEGWLQAMAESKPTDVNPFWYVYARVRELQRADTMAYLQDINTYQVLVGIETGCDQLAKDISKGNTNSDTLKVAERAKQYGIKILPSFVVGLPGESDESLEKTYKIAQRVVELNGSDELSVSMMIPLPGTKAFSDLREAHLQETGNPLPLLTDGEEYQRLWFKYKCNASFDTAISYMYKMMDMTPLKSTFGSPFLKIDPRMPGWNQISAESREELFRSGQR